MSRGTEWEAKEARGGKSDQSRTAQEEAREKAWTVRAESNLYFAVSGDAPEGFRGQQGFKMTSQPTAVFQRGQKGMAPFLQGRA